ncbi:HDOD domain-containing protein [Alkaliphilus transvaalensis]|uniref:HDOD domain-containing protein n=1 Tax=Alkaliphilus transvaalensis TaxID=114628 RepID=UPI00047D7CFF|nr:HDOD domain-containing protein [Alkaliphilus transvaalensis]
MKKKILLVDDEEQILKSLKRVFLKSDYEIFIAVDGMSALELLEKEKIDLIITDIRMPEMDGFQLLEAVKRNYPEVIRLVLSGFTDEKKIFQLIQNNLAKMYVRKPWNNDELLKNIHQVFELNHILTSHEMLKTIKYLEELPTFNSIYTKLCNLIDEEVNIREIEELLMKDPAIVASILRLVNSAFLNIKTASLKKAITYIGLTNVKNIALVASISYKSNLNIRLSKINELFSKHSLLTNQICSLIYSKFLFKEIPPDSSCIGLLNEIGRIVLLNNCPKEYEGVIAIAEKDQISLHEIEKGVFGVTHQEISGYLLNWWGLPYNLVEAILFHHVPLKENVINKELASVIHLADYYAAKLLNFPWGEKVNLEVFDFLNIKREVLEERIYKELQRE